MRRFIACVLSLSCVSACTMPTAWEVQEASPQQVLAREPPPEWLLVTLSDSSWVVLKEPTISGDSLFGVVYDGRYQGQRLEGGRYTGIRLDEVARVEVEWRGNWSRWDWLLLCLSWCE